jgi:DNA-binding NarL/FixJ family response regulator
VPAEPTLAWVTERIQTLHEVLTSGTPAAAFALRDLVGGEIVVEELQSEGHKRRRLRGAFRLQINSVFLAGDLGIEPTAEAEDGELVTIDFVDTSPLDAKAEQVKALWDQGKLGKQIAAELGCSRAQVTKLLKHWAAMHGVELPNGHARRKQIEQQTSPPLYQQIAGRAYELMHQGLLIAEIANELTCDINTVRKAVQHWCNTHGLPWIDGRTRRKSLDRKCRPRQDEEGDDDYESVSS